MLDIWVVPPARAIPRLRRPTSRLSLADAQVRIATQLGAASNILECHELGRRMEEAGTITPDEVAHHIVPGGGP